MTKKEELKMVKKILILIFSLFISSCSKDYYFKRDVKKIALDLYQMTETDQLVRNHKKYLQSYYDIKTPQHLVDSLTWLEDEEKLNSYLANNINSRVFNINSNHLQGIKKEDYLDLIKRMEIGMNYIDSINTIELIRKTKKYGFPSYKRLKNTIDSTSNKFLIQSPEIIFVHSPKRYFKDIRGIVINEYLKGRMDKNTCSRISWHINGRVGNPFPEDYSHCKVDTLR